jgi:hypothetical protein
MARAVGEAVTASSSAAPSKSTDESSALESTTRF